MTHLRSLPSIPLLFWVLLAGCAPSPTASPPAIRFTDVTEQAGIRFHHVNGATDQRYFPETMGSGGAFLDFDGDGWLDILLVNGRPLKTAPSGPSWRASTSPSRPPRWRRKSFCRQNARGRGFATPPRPPVKKAPTPALFRNMGDGTFTDVTSGSGLDVPLYGMGCAVGDYDNDGLVDLYITCALEPGRLFRNEGGGRFHDVTARAGVGNNGRFGTSCAWLDYDNDGWLDLFICNYVRYSLATDRPCYEGGKRYYCRPTVYPPDACTLYRGRGDGTFEDVSGRVGIAGKTGNALGVAVWDLDDDGWLEIVVANDLTPNHLFHNVPLRMAGPKQPATGARRFEEVGLEWGVAFGENARARAGMGIDVAEYRNDGRPAILISNFTGEPLSFFFEDAPEQFSDLAFSVGVGEAHLRFLGFGLFFFDYDNDGFADAFVGNGHIEPDIARFGGDTTYGQRNHLYRNRGDGLFEEIGQTLGEPFTYERVTRGAAYGDYDNDGDLDILITNNGQPAELLRNDGGNGRNWFQVELRGAGARGGRRGSNRSGIGASVTVRTGQVTQRDFVRSGSSYLSQSMLRRHFGLGSATTVDALEVRWPSGLAQTLRNVRANQRITLVEDGR